MVDFWGFGITRKRSLTPGDKNNLVRLARGKCEFCSSDIVGKGIVPAIHHIVPFASGGSDRDHNLIVLCPNCHSRVDQISRTALRAKIEYRMPKKSGDIAGTAKKTTKRAKAAKKSTAKSTTAKKTTKRAKAAKKSTAKSTTAKKTTKRATAAKKSTAKSTTAKKTTKRVTAAKK